MNERRPVEPHSVVGSKGPLSFTAGAARVTLPEAAAGIGQRSAEPKKSFFRGVAVGLAVMIPLWLWLILWLVR
jgi:hypothetical protein